MSINPFKDSNLDELQDDIKSFISDHSLSFKQRIILFWQKVKKKGNERLTVMFIPHSEKRIVNFHISKFTITFVITAFIIIAITTTITILSHTSTIKEVSKLERYKSDYTIQIQHYKKEFEKLHDTHQKFIPELTHLYSLTPGNNADELFAVGSGDESTHADKGDFSPSIESLNIAAMTNELKETKTVLEKIKKFLSSRKKIIENTPSLWPVNGYIISTFGNRISPFTLKKEFYKGIDIAAFPGAKIYATAPGTVGSIKWDSILGLTITVKHKYGFESIYSHCQRILVDVGQQVSKGEVIGYVGRSGKTTRHMCHYQIKIGTEPVDPVPYLNKVIKPSTIEDKHRQL